LPPNIRCINDTYPIHVFKTLVAITALRTTKALRVDFVKQTLRQEVSFFDSTTTPISSQITTNCTHVHQGISEKLGLIIQGFASFVAAFVVAFAVQWKLTLIIIAIVPVNLIITMVCVAIDSSIDYAVLGINSEGISLAEEMFSSIRTVHAFWAKPKLSRRFDAVLDRARAVGMKKSPVYAVLFGLEFFCVYCGYGLAFWQGIRMYARGEIDEVGKIVT
jgi:ATP-binding cassette subfamily B (MDR/TAP) protein 1